MIEIKVPKEITKYETKLIGPFTSRQVVVLLICVPIVAFCYITVSSYVDSSIAGYICLPFGAIGALFGWVKPYGLPFEKYLKSVFVSSFLAPTVRVYKTENYYDLISKKAKELTPEQLLLIDAVLEDVPEEEVKQALKTLKEQQKKEKKPKYQKSKKAVF